MTEDILSIRRDKIKALREKGLKPFGSRFEKTAALSSLKDDFEKGHIKEGGIVKVAGRLMNLREHGKSFFLISRIIQPRCSCIPRKIISVKRPGR